MISDADMAVPDLAAPETPYEGDPRMRYCCVCPTGEAFDSQALQRQMEEAGIEASSHPLVAAALLECEQLRTLQEHAAVGHRSYARFLTCAAGSQATPGEAAGSLGSREAARALAELEVQLHQLAAHGLLVSESTIQRQIRAALDVGAVGESPVTISTIGVPTCDRPASLASALASFARNASAYGRRPTLAVVDDTKGPSASAALDVTRAVRRAWGADVRYIGRTTRARYAALLAKRAGVDPEVAQYAMLGSGRYAATAGAARNTLLLYTAGEVCFLADDDTRGDALPATPRRPGVSLYVGDDLYEYWFYPDRETATASWPAGSFDLLGEHEQFLGRSVGSCLSEEQPLRLDHINGRLLEKIRHRGVRVRATFSGSLGDDVTTYHMYRLFLHRSCRLRLAETQGAYQERLWTPYVLRAPLQHILTDGPFCISMNVGLDNRELLPPFAPDLWHEDGVFGTLMSLGFPHSLKAHLAGCVMPHHRPQVRLEQGRTVGFEAPGANFIVVMILQAAGLPREGSAGERLAALGRHLREVGRLSEDDFERLVRRHCEGAVRGTARMTERLLHEAEEMPEPVRDDLVRYHTSLRRAFASTQAYAPADLPGSPSARLTMLRRHTLRLGALLEAWPALVDAARQFREEGYDPAPLLEGPTVWSAPQPVASEDLPDSLPAN